MEALYTMNPVVSFNLGSKARILQASGSHRTQLLLVLAVALLGEVPAQSLTRPQLPPLQHFGWTLNFAES